MPCASQGNQFFINEFDESLDEIMLDVVEATREATNLTFYINSEGGDSSRAFALVELIERAKAAGVVVSTVVLHDAHSGGSMVAVAGSKGARKVARAGNYLLHWGEVEATARSPLEMQRIAEANINHFNNILRLYEKYTFAGRDKLEEMMLVDHYYLSAQDAIRLGFADEYL